MSGLLSRLTPRRSGNARGFSLIELLLVMALIGIISAIAIPTFLGQRTRARVIGDAMSNAKVLSMALETRKAENGLYGGAGTYTWKSDGTRPSTDIAPSFTPQGNSQMDYTVEIKNVGLTYVLSVNNKGGGGLVYQTDQSGKELARQH
ncbi:type IV pilin protein [Geothrix fuzhouensis]|uniref:type IV pilin protein n=1 Tax=Geothrix fuzhouensis TaxID=2966451 RepID=UPI002148BAF4|nr:type II secretion system protein [Geothrix fuzhouensis]